MGETSKEWQGNMVCLVGMKMENGCLGCVQFCSNRIMGSYGQTAHGLVWKLERAAGRLMDMYVFREEETGIVHYPW